MSRKVRIVTHGGKAHRDEFLACCCAAWYEYREGATCHIERRLAMDTDLGSPDVWVIDTGGVFDGAMRNFDHHQDDPALSQECALTLVMRTLMPHSKYLAFCAVNPWLRTTAVHDSCGAARAAAALGIDMRTYNATRSPLERGMLTLFGEHNSIPGDGPLMRMMLDMGRMIFLEADEVHDIIPAKLAAAPPPAEHFGVRLWDIRSVTAEGLSNTAVINAACAQRGVDLVITAGGSGCYNLYRQPKADGKLNLFALEGRPGVRFTHRNGFYALIENSTEDTKLAGMIEDSVRSCHPPDDAKEKTKTRGDQ